MKKIIIHIIMTFCVILAIKAVIPTLKQTIISQIKYQDSKLKTQINNKINTFYPEKNVKRNQFRTLETAQRKTQKNLKNGKREKLPIPTGRFTSANLMRGFHEPTGYFPQNYTNIINFYQKNINSDENFINIFENMGIDKQKAKYIMQSLLNKPKESSREQFNRSKNNYKPYGRKIQR